MDYLSPFQFEIRRKFINKRKLVQQCLITQGQAVAPYEAEIDAIVARLYSLTDAELQIIRGEP